MSLKFKEFVDDLMEKAKINLAKDKELVPVLVVVQWNDEITVVPLDLSVEGKGRTQFFTSTLVSTFQPKFVAVISDSYLKEVSPAKAAEAMKNYKQGDLSKDFEATEAIIINVWRGGIKRVDMLVQKYHRNGNNIVWDKQELMEGAESAFFPSKEANA